MNSNFEWDAEKAEQNFLKHDVDFEEACSVFDDPIFITFLDEEHSIDEERYIIMGLVQQGSTFTGSARRAK